MSFKARIVPLGDAALLVQLGDEIDLAVNQSVHALAKLVNISPLEGIIETVPAYSTLLVHYDPVLLSFTQIKNHLRAKLSQINESKAIWRAAGTGSGFCCLALQAAGSGCHPYSWRKNLHSFYDGFYAGLSLYGQA